MKVTSEKKVVFDRVCCDSAETSTETEEGHRTTGNLLRKRPLAVLCLLALHRSLQAFDLSRPSARLRCSTTGNLASAFCAAISSCIFARRASSCMIRLSLWSSCGEVSVALETQDHARLLLHGRNQSAWPLVQLVRHAPGGDLLAARLQRALSVRRSRGGSATTTVSVERAAIERLRT